jgi:hypothetical protein
LPTNLFESFAQASLDDLQSPLRPRNAASRDELSRWIILLGAVREGIVTAHAGEDDQHWGSRPQTGQSQYQRFLKLSAR